MDKYFVVVFPPTPFQFDFKKIWLNSTPLSWLLKKFHRILWNLVVIEDKLCQFAYSSKILIYFGPSERICNFGHNILFCSACVQQNVTEQHIQWEHPYTEHPQRLETSLRTKTQHRLHHMTSVGVYLTLRRHQNPPRIHPRKHREHIFST